MLSRVTLTSLITPMAPIRNIARMSTSMIASRHSPFSSKSSVVDVYIALGSNLGDRSLAINQAIQELRGVGDVKRTSFLYETAPMYHCDQNNFLNAACLLRTELNPVDLLGELQRIEKQVGRTTTFRNGPRVLDLDMLLYGDELVHTERLQVPHPRIAERAFVLSPLCDIAPLSTQLADGAGGLKELAELYLRLPRASRDEVRKVMPVYNHLSNRTQILTDTSQQKIMGILNVTPDSFSDGGAYNAEVSMAVERALRMEAEGACIIDIGGESTRPGAATVPLEEELRRVIPVISAIRAAGCSCMISVDTRNAEVARQAILAGADMVNDVSAGKHDPLMLPTVGALGVPYIAMHMRGDPQTMQQPQHLQYTATQADGTVATDTVQVVAGELRAQLEVVDAHIPRWLQMVDPGIGFSKGYDQNMALLHPDGLQRFKEFLGDRWVVAGFSRKKFLNRVIGQSKAQRGLLGSDDVLTYSASTEDKDLATAAGCAALQGHADIVRVHNVACTRTACDVALAFK